MYFHIETYGCQMNVLDSELVASGLIEAGFSPCRDRKDADILLFNTCSIRQHAEDKVYSALGRLKQWKTQKPRRLIGVLGCMAQKDRERIFRRAPHVDLVLGPGRLDLLPEIVQDILETKRSVCLLTSAETPHSAVSAATAKHGRLEISLDRHLVPLEQVKASFGPYDPHRLPQVRKNPFQAMVRIMFGCDKFCSYCVVPSVRGPEQSRAPQDIAQEVRTLAGQGCREITLIGQTVNSYRYAQGEKTTRLSDLLEIVSNVDGIRRVRFVTNYPRGMSDALLFAVRDLPNVGPYFHVPAQSGSSGVLKRMNRNYTSEEYCDLLARIRDIVPGAAITSDFIVGFCGETEDEFLETKRLLRLGRFKNSFIFKYSPRSGTKSDRLYADDVPEHVKRRRNNELLDVQDEMSLELNREFLGRKVEVLIEEYDEKEDQLLGRTACDRIVACRDVSHRETTGGDASKRIGEFLEVEILEALPFTLLGRLAPAEQLPRPSQFP